MSSGLVALLHASADPPGIPECAISVQACDADENGIEAGDAAETIGPGDDPASNPAQPPNWKEPPNQPAAAGVAVSAADIDRDLWLYRDRTIALLRRYMRLSMQVGRMPSLLGREFFRARVTSYKASSFEDAVIFVHDVERCLEMLGEFDQKLIAKVVLQEYSQEEAGRLLGCTRRHAVRCFREALDRISDLFLKRALLARLPQTKSNSEKSCQEGKNDEFRASDSEQAKNNF
jgi:hypothetical protein